MASKHYKCTSYWKIYAQPKRADLENMPDKIVITRAEKSMLLNYRLTKMKELVQIVNLNTESAVEEKAL